MIKINLERSQRNSEETQEIKKTVYKVIKHLNLQLEPCGALMPQRWGKRSLRTIDFMRHSKLNRRLWLINKSGSFSMYLSSRTQVILHGGGLEHSWGSMNVDGKAWLDQGSSMDRFICGRWTKAKPSGATWKSSMFKSVASLHKSITWHTVGL